MNTVKEYHMEQGSPEWEAIRLGKMTGSKADLFLVDGKSKNGFGTGALTYIYRKIGEAVTGDAGEFGGSPSTDRGNSLEPLAIESYKEKNWFHEIRLVGFVELNSFVGCSPDALVGEDGMLEVKCPEHPEFVRMLVTGELKDHKKYMAQIQFNLFVTGRRWCDYVVFHPKFGASSLHVTRIDRDETMVAKFQSKAKAFQEMVESILWKIHDKEKLSV